MTGLGGKLSMIVTHRSLFTRFSLRVLYLASLVLAIAVAFVIERGPPEATALTGCIALASLIVVCIVAERLRRQAEADRVRMADFAEAIKDWFWESDADGKFTYLSPSFENAVGTPVKCRIGRQRYDLESSIDPDNPGWDAHLAALIARQPFQDFQLSVKSLASIRHWSVSGKPVIDDHGQFQGYRGATRDVTAEVEAQQALRRKESELAAALEKVHAANAAKLLFLANMSHELRTPLNAIIGFADIIRQPLHGPIDQCYRTYAEHIYESGQCLLRIITDVLDTSRILESDLHLCAEPCEFGEILRDCVRLVEDDMRKGGVRLVVNLADDFPMVKVDRLRIHRAVFNILSNAVRFNREGGSVHVSVCQSESGGLAIAVSDTGIGMSPEGISIALQPFQQLEGALTRRHGGAGLGLPLAKAFIELHGGSFEIDSEPGNGTMVVAYLPPDCILDRDAPRNRGETPCRT
jgi:signal transduction histidine kinase